MFLEFSAGFVIVSGGVGILDFRILGGGFWISCFFYKICGLIYAVFVVLIFHTRQRYLLFAILRLTIFVILRERNDRNISI